MSPSGRFAWCRRLAKSNLRGLQNAPMKAEERDFSGFARNAMNIRSMAKKVAVSEFGISELISPDG
jgi:hypothetical protein